MRVKHDDRIFFVPQRPDAFVVLRNGNILEHNVNLYKPLTINAGIMCEDFYMGSSLGYTFYELGEKINIPLDHDRFFFEETNEIYNIMLARRFYVLSQDVIHEDLTITALYEECKDMVLKGRVIVTEDTAIQLAVISIYA